MKTKTPPGSPLRPPLRARATDRRRWLAAALTAVLSPAGAAAATDPGPDLEAARRRVRFRHEDRPVKVVSLGGSIAAWPRNGYPDLLARYCPRIEVVDLAKTGLGAYALKRRFVELVLRNPWMRFGREGEEYWLLLGGTLNSVGRPANHNHHTRRLFELAHRRGIRVVALTPTPWGDLHDRRFARPLDAVAYVEKTRAIADFVLGRGTPAEDLGAYAARRAGGAEAPYRPEERPDVAVDLWYGDVLRWTDAELLDPAEVARAIERDPRWRRAHRNDPAPSYRQALDEAVDEARRVPRTFLRPELRSFDHIHPNEAGHLRMAAAICPALPASWGCTCPPQSAGDGGTPADPAETAPADEGPPAETASADEVHSAGGAAGAGAR